MHVFRGPDCKEEDRSVNDGRRECPNRGSAGVEPAPSIEHLPEHGGCVFTTPHEQNME
jgi:hypothetical protein